MIEEAIVEYEEAIQLLSNTPNSHKLQERVFQQLIPAYIKINAIGKIKKYLSQINTIYENRQYNHFLWHDGGSETYVAAKVKACEVCGFKSSLIRYEADVTEAELLAKVEELNKDEDVDGFIVQLPLPKHISEQKVIEAIDYRKDVDGFHPINVGRLSIGLPCRECAESRGILEESS